MFASNYDNIQFKSRTTIDITVCPQYIITKITALAID
jgi:hypothetical protein